MAPDPAAVFPEIGPDTWPEAWAELDRRLDSGSAAPLAVAFSGGGDSLALLHLVAAWAERHRRPVLALTVDHGLHPQSLAWTAAAGEAASRVDVAWRVLPWTGEKPLNGLPAAARAARHALIAEAARAAGASVVLFGHTADDVAESDHMRAGDAPGLGRLRGWSPSPAWPQGRGLFLCRPLLTTSRRDLRAWLRAAGRDWIEDPANTDPRFARTRARAAVRRADAATDLAGVARDVEVPEAIVATTDGRLLWSRPQLHALSTEALTRLLGLAVVCAGGGDRLPKAAALARLVDRVRGADGLIATLAGARLTADATTVEAAREAGERRRAETPPPLVLDPARATVWDGRYLLHAHAPGWSVDAAAGRLVALPKMEREAVGDLPPAARRALPALIHRASGEVRLPAPFGGGPARSVCLVSDRFTAARGGVVREADIAPVASGALGGGALDERP